VLPPTTGGLWVWARGERVLVACNLSDDPATVPDVDGEIRISTIRARDGEIVSDELQLDAWEAAVVWRT
jgi:hypothetical protein